MAIEWQREQEFMKTLGGAVKKPSKTAVDKLVKIAVEDEALVRHAPGRLSFCTQFRPQLYT